MFSVGKIYDHRYLTDSVGKGAENYYLSAIREHGEPPGYWSGRGAMALSLPSGSQVDPKDMEKLYDGFFDIRDPKVFDDEIPDSEKSRLGRKMANYSTFEEIYQRKLEAEPEATEERREQLRIKAKKETRKALNAFDMTFSPTKSVTLLHAGLLATEKQAREAGDLQRAEAARQAATILEDTLKEASAVGVEEASEEAGWARVGYHGKKVNGDSTGRWAPAGGWVVASFFQHTSRNGDPQLHIHNAVLNRQLCEDGVWRSLDGQAIYRARAAFSAIAERSLMELLTARLGVRWIQRQDGQGFEISGVTTDQVAEFSTRRVEVTGRLEELVQAYERKHGYSPNARTTFGLAQQATKDTKVAKAKGAHVPSADQELEAWERRTTRSEIDSLTAIPERSLFQVSTEEREAASAELEQLDMDRVVQAALADAQKEKATFTRWEMTRHLARYLPSCLGGLDAAQVRRLLHQMTEEALSPSTGRPQVLRLNIPDVVDIPSTLMRDHEWSVFRSPSAERWTTPDQLEDEQRFLTSAAQVDSPVVEAGRAAERIGLAGADAPASEPDAARVVLDAEPSELSPQGAPQELPTTAVAEAKSGTDAVTAVSDEGESAPEPEASRPGLAFGLAEDQAAAVYGILTSGRRTDVLEGYAGTGKSYTVSRLAELWRELTSADVVGLTTAQSAAQVLKDEGLDAAHNIARWLRAGAPLAPGQLVVVDEASMVTTEHMVQIQQAADKVGAKVLLTGDSEQLAAPGAGGLMRQLVAERGSFKLTKVFRFTADWEKDASIRLRSGDEDVLRIYDQHGRLRGGTREEMEQGAVEAFLADHLSGKESLLLTATNGKAAELAGRVRDSLVSYGLVDDTETVPVRGGNTAGVGDLITARRNDRGIELMVDGQRRTLTNRDRLTVTSMTSNGSVWARLLDKRGRPGELVLIPAEYAGRDIELAYAGTAHAGQGRTVDTCHAVVEDGMSRQALYVEMSRGREGNWAWTVTDVESADIRPEDTFESTADAATSNADEAAASPETTPPGDPATPTDPEADQPVLPGLEESSATPVPAPVAAMSAANADPSTTETASSESDRDAVGVLAEILETDQSDQTAIEAMRVEADRVTHLAHLGSMWQSLVKDDLANQTSKALAAQLPAKIHSRLDNDPARGSVLTTVRQAVLAGHDLNQVVARAAEESWEGVRSVGQALSVRIERIIGTGDTELTSWSQATPQLANAEYGHFVAEVAEQMDARVEYLGERAAHNPPSYILKRLGEVPEEVMARTQWQQRAGRIEAYREQFGNEREQTNVLGTAPDRNSPEQRMSWFAAARALGQNAAEQAVGAARDGALWVKRAAYARATQWAPPNMAEDLRRTTIERDDRSREAVRLRAQAAVEQDEMERLSLEAKAIGAEVLWAAASDRREQLQSIQDQRQEWVEATEEMRREAMLADAELHRRHEDLDLPALHEPTEAEQRARGHQRATEETAVDVRDEVIDGQGELFGLGEAGRVLRGGLTERPEEPEPVSTDEIEGHIQEELDLGLAEETPVQEGDTQMRRALEKVAAAKTFMAGFLRRNQEAQERAAAEEPTVEERAREERYRDELSRREETELERRREQQEKKREQERPAAERSGPEQERPTPEQERRRRPPERRGPELDGPSLG